MKRGILLAFFIGLFVAVFFFATQKAEIDITEPTELDLYTNDYWQSMIAERGSIAAYDTISTYEEHYGLVFTHGIAHAFGGALYEKENVAGITVCDDRFLYGCVHELVAMALMDRGGSIVEVLAEQCNQIEKNSIQAVACQHGIGHGLIGFLGYQEHHLSEALNICAISVDKGNLPKVQGCMGGVFMEYNLRALKRGDGVGDMRRLQTSVTEPCDSLTDSGRLGCIYWQVQWWQQGLLKGGNDESAQSTLGKYCDQVSQTDEEQQVCYGSIGTFITPATSFRYEPSALLCRSAAQNDKQALYCAIRAYRTISKYTDTTLDDRNGFCKLVDPVNPNECLTAIQMLHGESDALYPLTSFLYSPL
ncbi:MAG: hypothetical protein ACI92I_000449 [Acidimicrobiales bacterium]|jgi:hypothetical protein